MSAIAPVSCASSEAPGVDAHDRDEGDQAQVLEDVARGVGRAAEEPQPRDDRRDEDAREQQAAGVAQADREAAHRHVDLRRSAGPATMPTDSVSRSVAVLGRATLPSAAASLSTALLSPATNSTSNRCSLVSAPSGNRHAAALHADAPGAGRRTPRCGTPSAPCPSTLLLVTRISAWSSGMFKRLGVGHFGAQQPHVGGQVLEPAAQGHDVAQLHRQVGARARAPRRRAPR